MPSSISSKGQVTLPLQIRKHLGVAAGDKVDFVIEEGSVVVRPLHPVDNPFEKYRGVLGRFPGGEKGIKQWVDEMRNEEGSDSE